MAKRKFQIGDRVKVVKKTGVGYGVKIGREGIVINYHVNYFPYPYQVQFHGQIGKQWFNAKELELVNRKGNK
jgi:hypothetical protein